MTADDASVNGRVDRTVSALERWRHLLKFVCQLHKQQAVAKIELRFFHAESTGLLHMTLASQFCGPFRRLKRSLSAHIWEHFGYYPHGESGAGADAAEHRRRVFQHFGPDLARGLTGKRAKRRLLWWTAVQQMLNGDYQSQEVAHYCRGLHKILIPLLHHDS